MAESASRTNRVNADSGRGGSNPARKQHSELLGRRIAALRRERDMTVSELSRGSAISSSMISQIENGRSLPSVATLHAIADALQAPVATLFAREGASRGTEAPPIKPSRGSAESPGGEAQAAVAGALARAGLRAPRWDGPRPGTSPLLHADERQYVEMEGGVRWERLTPFDLPGAEVIGTTYAPGAASGAHMHRHSGVETHIVLEGRVDVEIRFDRFELSSGDTITFESTHPHRYSNPGEVAAHGITLIVL
jgi:transcriptional regulator with XRE-family HTH domain